MAEEDLAAPVPVLLVAPCGGDLARLVPEEVSLRAVVAGDADVLHQTVQPNTHKLIELVPTSRGLIQTICVPAFFCSTTSMDQIPSQDHQQKDFLAFLFPDSPPDQHRPHDAHQPDVLATAHRIPNTLTCFTGSNNPPANQQPLDLMAMSLQGLDTTTLPSPAALTPQMLLEQQYKLTQLHQLQQLQNQIQSQIFQQQASPLPSPRHHPRFSPTSPGRSFSEN